MDDNDRVIIPPWDGDTDKSDDGVSKIQLNPQTAVIQGNTKANVRRFVTAAGFMAALIIDIFAGFAGRSSRQPLDVRARVDRMRSFTGTIAGITREQNRFTVRVTQSQDPLFTESGTNVWNVLLPPGASLNDPDAPLKACFKVSDVSGNLADAGEVPCAQIILPGAPVLVEYVSVRYEDATVVARVIFGSRQ